jgi:DNA primase
VGRIPENVVSEIRDRADIVSVVGRHVTLKKVGSRFWGLCPFHDEKTASFQVHADKQIFYCFGCGAGGDVFAFRMRMEGLDFPDVLRVLGRELGIAVPETGGGDEGQAAAAFRANEAAAAFFRNALRGPEGAAARRYLHERGVPEDLAERFRIGWAPDGWDGLIQHLRRVRVTVEEAEIAGLVARRPSGDGHYDRFRARVVFPILEPTGQVAGFGGRGMGSEPPKYLNSPESPVYKKSRALFGLPQALEAIRERGRVIVVEGYFDLLALHRAGLCEGIAPCGTALTQAHARRIRRYASEVVLLFDGDAAGQTAAERSLPILLAEGLRVRAAFLPLGEDPDTLVAKSGLPALRACVESAVPLLDHLIERALKEGAGHAWAAADTARSVAPYLRALSDPVERAAYTRLLSSRLEIPPSALDEALRQGAEREAPRGASAEPPARPRPKSIEISPTVRMLIATLASHPEVLPYFDALETSWLPDDAGAELLACLQAACASGGRSGAASLVSPEASLLDETQKALLGRIMTEAPALDAKSAARSVSDCIAKLEIAALTAAKHALEERRGTCTDPAGQNEIDEELQRITSRRHDLQKKVRQV